MNRPPSATTSRISVTGRRDYGVKFMADVDEIVNSTTQVDSNAQPPITTSREVIKPIYYQPPPDWERCLEAGGPRRDDDDDDEEYHPFWLAWLDMFIGLGMMISASLKIPLVMGHGIAKTLHYIPTLYNDDTVRKWPKMNSFISACSASFVVLLFGLLHGITDWFVLPYKGANKEGPKGFFKGFAKGIGSILFKIPAGVIGFVAHPLFGIYKEAAKFKVVIKRERGPRQDVASLI
ncbi:hypothetical protein F4677DRAFT_445164 [Hypoxylon crocopeplum]|nr:hypothetical protein F4677DRAFT_445164 [Hypoxylon crocopeplum]